MHLLLLEFCCFLVIKQSLVQGLNKGDSCTTGDGGFGKCKSQSECALATKTINGQRSPTYQNCGFDGFQKLLCCPTSISERACDHYFKNASTYPVYLISDGIDAELGEYPHMAALAYYFPQEKWYSFDCGGTLISDRFVLTAAHCIKKKTDLTFVRMGEVNVPKTTTKFNASIDYIVKAIYRHPNYEPKHCLHDLALLKLAKRVKFTDNLKPACLHTEPMIPDEFPDEFKILGWGDVNNNDQRSNILQKATIDYVDPGDCQQQYWRVYQRDVQDDQICASNGKKTICKGDSGGPLQVIESKLPRIIGVASIGADGCGSPFPSIYTNIQKHLTWIENIVWKDSFL